MKAKIIIPPSPFINQRKEREPSSMKIFINYEDYSYWASDKNCLIKGSRGTGKSSVLRVFGYETQWFNRDILYPVEELKKYFSEKPNVVGLLFRCDKVDINLWENWRNKYSDNNHNAKVVFSTYINLYYVEEILKALIEIKSQYKTISFTKSNIPYLISEIQKICYPEASKRPQLYNHSIENLKDQLNDTRHSLRQRICSLETFEFISKNYSFHMPNNPIVDKVCSKIIEVLPFFKEVCFFLLLDDVDRLEEWQIKVINSMMKVITSPCSFKLSCLSEYKTMSTVDGVTISNTDLHISNLYDEDKYFENNLRKKRNKLNDKIDELFNAIFNFRAFNVAELYSDHNNELNFKYKIEEIFGTCSIEDNILEVLRGKSIGKDVNALLEEFDESGEEKITDFWLLKNGILKEKKEKNDRKKFDKYRPSAAFSILHTYNLIDSFNYCSYDLIRLISSGSPRHFLRICNAMWKDIYSALVEKNYPVKKTFQNEAIRRASDDLFENIDKERFDNEISVSCHEMCLRLSEIFTQFISIDSLKITPECLSIQINEDDIGDKNDKVTYQKIIDKLITIEAIKIRKESNDSKIKIALNPMLTPHFCLPYRSPFHYSHIVKDSIKFICLLKETKKEIVKEIIDERIKKGAGKKS